MFFFLSFFFFNVSSTTEIYTLSLHDALPILVEDESLIGMLTVDMVKELGYATLGPMTNIADAADTIARSEEHTSELQSLRHLVCRLLLEKKKMSGRHPSYRSHRHILLRALFC